MRLIGIQASYIIAAIVLSSSCSLGDSRSKGAEAAVSGFYDAFYKQKWDIAAEKFHREGLDFFKGLCLRMVRTTEDPKERAELLKKLGVTSLDALKQMEPKRVFAKFFGFAFSGFNPEFRKMWGLSTVEVVGSVPEKDQIHVVFRTRSKFEDLSGAVISVATAKLDGKVWKVLSSTQMDALRKEWGQ